VAVGLGLLVLFMSLAATLPRFPNGVIAASAIPFLAGLGLLFEYRMRCKEIDAGGFQGVNPRATLPLFLWVDTHKPIVDNW
jgi:hypothetical protein